MSSDSRAFPNHFDDYDATKPDNYFTNDGQLTAEFCQQIRGVISNLLKCVDQAVAHQQQPGTRASEDHSVYTGVSGISLLYYKLSTIGFNAPDLLAKATSLNSQALKACRGRRKETFLCGDGGPIALRACLCQANGDQTGAHQAVANLVDKIDGEYADPAVPDEFLYGRVGVLYSILFVRDRVTAGTIDHTLVEKIAACIIESGRNFAARHPQIGSSPLMYSWYDELYLGAAHGLCGIVFVVLQLPSVLSNEGYKQSVKGTVDYLLTQQYPSGNVRSSVGSDGDRLVHWCHGAPGAVHTFIMAHKVFGDAKYLEAAVKCGECIWQRGLLKKGYGLCHGVAGNAYGLLALWQHTNDLKWLHRTCQFAVFLLQYGSHGCRTPDRPYSLMEGMSGTIYFLADLLQPSKAAFPAFYW